MRAIVGRGLRLLTATLLAASVVLLAGAPSALAAPHPPWALSAGIRDGHPLLKWIGSGSPGVTGYRVYRAVAGGSWPAAPLATTGASARGYLDASARGGVLYVYRLTAVDSSGESKFTRRVYIRAPDPPGPCGVVSRTPRWDHVVWIVMENKSYSQVIGSANAPYINALASQCGLATQFFAETQPSLPNYIAMTSGSTQGMTDDAGPSSHPLSVPSIFSQLAGNWRALQESMPSNCAMGNSGLYAVRHNPPTYYTNIASECATRDVPLADPPELSARFTFITPNLCSDMHSCPGASDVATQVRNGDTWLSQWIPKLVATPEYQAGRTAIFLTWDEDNFTAVNQIATIVISPSTFPATRAGARYDHYAMLRSTEEMLGLATDALGPNVANAPSLRADFGL